MAVSMVNLVEFAHALDIMDKIATPAVVTRALHAVGLSRAALREQHGFIPYDLEARVVEHVARAIGDVDLGTHIAQQADYAMYDAYARYVLGARDLRTALVRGRRAFSLIHPGSQIVMRRQDGHLIVGRKSSVGTMIGHHHMDDAAILLIARVMLHYLGPDWRPPWVESTARDNSSTAFLSRTVGAPARTGADFPAVAIRAGDLATPNPSPPDAQERVSYLDLPALMQVKPPETMAEAVEQVLRTQFVLGDLSEDSVAGRLSVGRRTLQRALRVEATSFREVKARFLETRARALLAESDLTVPTIARALGYDEPHSFRRAFRNWTGLTPNTFRAAARAT